MRAGTVTGVGAPALLVVVAGLLGSVVAASTEIYFVNALVAVAIVVSLYVFVGNSGVLSFGHISFVAVGAWTAGVLTVPVSEKPAIMQYLFPFLRDHTVGNVPSLAIAAGVGGVFALVIGLPLMRLSGLAAGIATFGVLEITHNVLRYYEKIGPGTNTFSSVPETTTLVQATIGAVVAIAVAFAYQQSRFGRLMRASREDAAAARAVGVSIYRQRLLAFALSGALAGFAGAFLAVEVNLSWNEGQTQGLGFIALAALILSNWNPIRLMAAAFIFGFAQAIPLRLADAPIIGAIPPEFIRMTPYVVTIVVLAGFVGKVRPPAAAGRAYDASGGG